jgi:hypothetical protein
MNKVTRFVSQNKELLGALGIGVFVLWYVSRRGKPAGFGAMGDWTPGRGVRVLPPPVTYAPAMSPEDVARFYGWGSPFRAYEPPRQPVSYESAMSPEDIARFYGWGSSLRPYEPYGAQSGAFTGNQVTSPDFRTGIQSTSMYWHNNYDFPAGFDAYEDDA